MADAVVDDILADVHRKGIKPFETGIWGFGFDLEKDKIEAFEGIKARLESRRYQDIILDEVSGEELLLGVLKKPLPCNSVKIEFALKELDGILADVNSRINQFAFIEAETSESLAIEQEVRDQLLNSVTVENTVTGDKYRREDGVFKRVSSFFSKKGK